MENTMAIRFDKLKFVKTLEKEANQSPEVAEAFAKAFDEALEQSQSPLATKQDLKQEIHVLKQEISQLETRLTEAMYKMAGFIILGVGAILGIFKFFG